MGAIPVLVSLLPLQTTGAHPSLPTIPNWCGAGNNVTGKQVKAEG